MKDGRLEKLLMDLMMRVWGSWVSRESVTKTRWRR